MISLNGVDFWPCGHGNHLPIGIGWLDRLSGAPCDYQHLRICFIGATQTSFFFATDCSPPHRIHARLLCCRDLTAAASRYRPAAPLCSRPDRSTKTQHPNSCLDRLLWLRSLHLFCADATQPQQRATAQGLCAKGTRDARGSMSTLSAKNEVVLTAGLQLQPQPLAFYVLGPLTATATLWVKTFNM